MRKVTQQIKSALEAGKGLTVGNTTTDGKSVWLHGNEIIRKFSTGGYEVSLAGWPTATTRERIRGITGADIYQKNYTTYINGGEALLHAWYPVH